MKFYGEIRGGTRKNCLNFGSDQDLLRWVKNLIIIIACPDQGKGTNPDALGLALHHQGRTFSNAYCQANLWISVMQVVPLVLIKYKPINVFDVHVLLDQFALTFPVRSLVRMISKLVM